MATRDEQDPHARVNLPILDAAFKANPYPLYESFRRAPACIVPVRFPSGVEAWLVTAYAAARQLLSDPRLVKDPSLRPKHDASSPTGVRTASHSIFRHLLTMDPPDHTRLRSIVAREFSSERVRALRPRIQRIADDLLDALASRDEADLIVEFALPFPLMVICQLLGISPADEPRVRRWAAQFLSADFENPAMVPMIAQEVHEYLLALARQKRAAPDNLPFSALVAAHDNGELSESELTAMGFLLLMAGHETTVNLIGNAVLALLRNRPEWTKLCVGESVSSALEELLRFDSPLEVATARFADTEIVIDDVRIRKGDLVFVGLAAANRDPAWLDRADRLDVSRTPPASHLAFGHGIHYCLGASLARLEGEIALTELCRRFPELELGAPAEDLAWKPGLIMRGLERLPVRLKRSPSEPLGPRVSRRGG